jgi:hypothetical protein
VFFANDEPPFFSELSLDYGRPVAPPTLFGTTFERRYTRCVVSFDCQTFTGDVVF